MPWWLWWVVAIVVVDAVAIRCWFREASTQAFSYSEEHHQPRKFKRRKIQIVINRILLIIAGLLTSPLIIALIILLCFVGIIESLRAPKIKPVRPA